MTDRIKESLAGELQRLKNEDNFRSLPEMGHCSKEVTVNGRKMLNLTSNDYLGIASDGQLWREFCKTGDIGNELPSSSSSRLLTGNFPEYGMLENSLAGLFGRESALVFNSGYHANTGILPALAGTASLILADKLVHASIVDGIRLSGARYIRYRHNDLGQLERLVDENAGRYERVFIVTESIFSMDGDETDLTALAGIRHRHDNVMLYIDEAHAFGVRGERGTGCAEQQGVTNEIDLLVGTFGKAAASEGAYIICDNVIREYLINKMRTLIFTTALPPLNVKWTDFVVRRLPGMKSKREDLGRISKSLREKLEDKGLKTPSSSHIIPIITGDSHAAIKASERLRDEGFYVLPVRPPTVPAGSSRLRISLTACITEEEVERLSRLI